MLNIIKLIAGFFKKFIIQIRFYLVVRIRESVLSTDYLQTESWVLSGLHAPPLPPHIRQGDEGQEHYPTKRDLRATEGKDIARVDRGAENSKQEKWEIPPGDVPEPG